MQLNRNLWPERCSSWALKVGREVSTGTGRVGSCRWCQLWSPAGSICSEARNRFEVSLRHGTEVSQRSRWSGWILLSHLLASTRYLYQTVEVNISASLQWWKICFISLYGVTCSPGMQSGKAKMRGMDWGAQHNFAMWREEGSLHLERQVNSMPFTVLKQWWFTHIGEGKKTSPQQLALVLLQAELIHRV